MKIVLFEVAKDKEEVFRGLFPGHDVSFFEEKLTGENASLAKDAEIISVFINSRVDKQAIDVMPKLQFITTRSTGFDHIDVEYCKSKNIKVANVPEYGSSTVAEHTFALLLNLTRKIPQAIE